MPLDTWFMRPGWEFLDAFSIEEFLDKMEQNGVPCLGFGAALPVPPDPHHYEGALKGYPAPATSLDRKSEINAFLRAAQKRDFRSYSYGTNPHMSLSDGERRPANLPLLLYARAGELGRGYKTRRKNWMTTQRLTTLEKNSC